MNIFKRIISSYFNPNVISWEVVEEEETTIDLCRGGKTILTIPAKLVKEKSSAGDIRYMLYESVGFRKGKPYEVDINTGEPIK